jgi:major vault protein
LKAIRPFVDNRDGNHERFVDDEYLFKGPGTYIPRIEETIKSRIEAIIVLPNHALLLKAKRDTEDSSGTIRKAGETVRYATCLFFIVASQKDRLFHA